MNFTAIVYEFYNQDTHQIRIPVHLPQKPKYSPQAILQNMLKLYKNRHIKGKETKTTISSCDGHECLALSAT